MIRYLQVVQGKPVRHMKAAAAMKQGAPVAQTLSAGTVAADTGVGDYLVDVDMNYDGMNAIMTPMDNAAENIAEGADVLMITPLPGERYATTELTAAGLAVGDPLVTSAGKFVKATASASGVPYQWIYGGAYDDPTGTMYIVERVNVGSAKTTG